MTDAPKWNFGIFRSILEDLGKGLPREEAAKRIDGALGNKGCRKREQRYNCPICLDDGRVLIWSPYLVRDFELEGVHPDQARHRETDVACFCKQGECHPKLPRFDPSVHCKIVPIAGATGRTCDPRALADLMAWLEDRKKRAAAERPDPLFHQERT